MGSAGRRGGSVENAVGQDWPLQHNLRRRLWPKKRGGVSKLILKGERALREIIASGRPMTQSITAIKCLNLAQALAAKQTFGPRELDA